MVKAQATRPPPTALRQDMSSSRIVVLAAALAGVAWASACGDATGVEGPSPVGFWDVWSVDGQALPISDSDNILARFESGSLDIRANGSFARRFRGSFLGVPFDETQSGDWTQTGTTVFLNPHRGCQDTALLENRDVLKIDADCEDGREIVYVR